MKHLGNDLTLYKHLEKVVVTNNQGDVIHGRVLASSIGWVIVGAAGMLTQRTIDNEDHRDLDWKVERDEA